MAESLLGAVFEKLLSLAQNEFATMSGIKGKAEKLSRTLELIKAVVEDAEEKQITNKPIKVWLQQLKDAVYVLDDILDECSIESLRHKGLSSLKPKSIKFRYEIGNKLKEISSRFDEIADQKNKYVLKEGVRERSTEVAEWRQTSSFIPQPKLYGREDDKEKIVKFLLSQARESDFLSIYPIVGLGGMGKTTLAQMVYNDDQVTSNFNIKVWICVSENFSVQRILCSIIECITKERHDRLNLDVTERKVQELLQGKRYLLVLDDVWRKNEEIEFGLTQDKWNKLKCVLSCASKGASILVSTRDMEVAKIMGTCEEAHHLCGISEDECWMLLKQYAFGTVKEGREELVAIGKEIVKKCGGSPLAAQALGGLLHSRNGENEWLEVLESGLWNLESENSILPALRLSYFHLSPTIRRCFAFCAMFPKDTEIQKEDLIHLWIANDFISSRANLEVEDVGNMIWNELYQKSFFQDMRLDDYSGHIYFKMHDLVHDLAQSIMGQECMVLGNANKKDLSTSTRHVGFGSDQDVLSLHKRAFKKVESLRTLYQLHLYIKVSGCFPTHRNTLRVLCTGSFNFSSLKSLIHLRYLQLFGLEIKTLPDSIYSLRKLQILKLRFLRNLICLPKDLACLLDLRHLFIEDCDSLSCMFPNIGKLSHLRTLSKYIVSAKIGHSLTELHDLNLGGDLCIKGLQNVDCLSEAQEANLMGKKDLHKLQLIWGKVAHTKPYATNPELVLNALQPHLNLKKLVISGYDGLQFPTWIGMLTNLVSLDLFGSVKCLRLPSLGKLPYLRKIKISEMYDVQYMDDEESYDGVEVKAFPSLEELRLSWCPKLERLLKVERGGNFPCLFSLEIRGCPKLEWLLKVERGENFPRLSDLTLYGCKNCVRLPSLGKLPYLRRLKIDSVDMQYMDDDESYDGVEVKAFPSLEELSLRLCPKLEWLLKGERGDNFPCLSSLDISACPKLELLYCSIPSLKSLKLTGYTNALLRSLSGFNGLTYLYLSGFEDLTFFPVGTLTCLQTLAISVSEVELLNEIFKNLNNLELLRIWGCNKLESLPEQGWEDLFSLRTLEISVCHELKSLPDGVRHLTSLQLLRIEFCPTLAERCKEGTGEDWDKIAHVSNVEIPY